MKTHRPATETEFRPMMAFPKPHFGNEGLNPLNTRNSDSVTPVPLSLIRTVIVMCGLCFASLSYFCFAELPKPGPSTKDFLDTIVKTQQQDEDGGQKRIQSWERVSDPSVIDELFDAFDNGLTQSRALGAIVNELKLPESEKIRLLSNRAKHEVNPVKRMAAMGQLDKFKEAFPEVLNIWVSALSDVNRFDVPSRLSEGDMRVCDGAFNLIIGNLELRKLLVHHSLPWTFEIGDGVPVDEKDRRIGELKRFLASKGLVVMGASKPPTPALPATPAATPAPSTPVPTATPTPSSPAPTVAESPAPPERKSPVWPWVVGIAALIAIVMLALKRRS